MDRFNRRRILKGAAALAGAAVVPGAARAQSFDDRSLYGPITGEPFPVPAINLSRIRPGYLRTVVDYDSGEKPGTIVVDPAHKYLYLTDGRGQAIRYGVGVGRQGFGWSGTAYIHDKREWPDWYPPKEMMARDPHVMQVMSKLQSGLGMHGGPGNPLGARAMYLFQGNKDTLYRIHGTVEPWTIGTSVSSGCIRMINQDAIDLYNRVAVGTKVLVLGTAGERPVESEPVPQEHYPADQDPGQVSYSAPDQGAYGAPDQAPTAPGQAPGYDPYDPLGFSSGRYDPNQ